MNKSVLIALGVFAFVVVLGVLLLKGKKGREKGKGFFEAKEIATANEQAMFWRLVGALPMPEFVVLTQVSFGALLVARGEASRWSFSQKRADFVVCNKGFKVLAVIELDDSSHKGREQEDNDRDAMLIEAGYRVLRYKRIPEVAQLRADIT